MNFTDCPLYLISIARARGVLKLLLYLRISDLRTLVKSYKMAYLRPKADPPQAEAFPLRFAHSTRSGVASATEEYVPAIIPTRSVSAKSLVDSGPRIKSAMSEIATVTDVFTDRTNV